MRQHIIFSSSGQRNRLHPGWLSIGVLMCFHGLHVCNAQNPTPGYHKLRSISAPRKDHRGVDLISDALPFGSLWYAGQNALARQWDYAKFSSRSHHAVIRVYDGDGNLITTHEHAGDFNE
jgi:hypothetical protein